MKKNGTMLISLLAAASLLCSCGDTGGTDSTPDSAGSDKPGAPTAAMINESEPESSSVSEETAVVKESEKSTDSSAGLLKNIFGGKTGANGREYREWESTGRRIRINMRTDI